MQCSHSLHPPFIICWLIYTALSMQACICEYWHLWWTETGPNLWSEKFTALQREQQSSVEIIGTVLPTVLASVNLNSFSLKHNHFLKLWLFKLKSPALHLGSNLPSFSWTTTQAKYPTALVNERAHTCDVLPGLHQTVRQNLCIFSQIMVF